MTSVRVYPHNDLLNLAFYQRETINTKVQSRIEDAISLDCPSCIISLAFATEAIANLAVHRKIPN